MVAAIELVAACGAPLAAHGGMEDHEEVVRLQTDVSLQHDLELVRLLQPRGGLRGVGPRHGSPTPTHALRALKHTDVLDVWRLGAQSEACQLQALYINTPSLVCSRVSTSPHQALLLYILNSLASFTLFTSAHQLNVTLTACINRELPLNGVSTSYSLKKLSFY